MSNILSFLGLDIEIIKRSDEMVDMEKKLYFSI